MSRTVCSIPAEVHLALGGELHPAQRPPIIVRQCDASAIPRGVAVQSQVNSARLILAVIACVICLPIALHAKKPSGKVPNPKALAAVESYCIDTSQLSDWDRHIVDNFLKLEYQPKHLLTRLPWKLVESCRDGNPDAVATVEFEPLNVVQVLKSPGGTQISGGPDRMFRAVLTVGDSSNDRLLYRVGSAPYRTSPGMPVDPGAWRDAIYHVFWALIEDLPRARAGVKK